MKYCNKNRFWSFNLLNISNFTGFKSTFSKSFTLDLFDTSKPSNFPPPAVTHNITLRLSAHLWRQTEQSRRTGLFFQLPPWHLILWRFVRLLTDTQGGKDVMKRWWRRRRKMWLAVVTLFAREIRGATEAFLHAAFGPAHMFLRARRGPPGRGRAQRWPQDKGLNQTAKQRLSMAKDFAIWERRHIR